MCRAIPHSLRSDETLEMCFFVRDQDKAAIKEKLKANPIPGLTKVMSLKKLKTHYKRFEDRRKLVASYDLFLADDRIIPSLSKPLGKIFYQRKKQPVAVRVENEHLRNCIEHARDSTFMFLSMGPCVAVRIAHTGMEVDEIVANVMSGIKHAVEKIPRKWKNIQGIYLKTVDSVALPLYNALPDPSFKIATTTATPVLAAAEPVTDGESNDVVVMSSNKRKGMEKKKVASTTKKQKSS